MTKDGTLIRSFAVKIMIWGYGIGLILGLTGDGQDALYSSLEKLVYFFLGK